MKLRSIKFKISVLYIAVLGLILVLYSGFLYISLYNSLYRDLDGELAEKAEKTVDAVNRCLAILGDDEASLAFAVHRVFAPGGKFHKEKKDLSDEQKKRIADFEKKWLVQYGKLDLGEDFIHFVRPDGQSIGWSKNMSFEMRSTFPKRIGKPGKNGAAFTKFKFKKKNLRCIQVPFVHKGETRYLLQIGTSQKQVIGLLENRQFFISVSIPIILVLAGFLGQFLVTKILKPVREMTETARNITYEDLTRRITAGDADEEIRILADAFNDMIARLEKSFKHIEEFSSQVAHELKTPIAIIRGEVELALRKERSCEEYKRVLKVSLEEAKRLLKTIEDLLLLSKLDYRPEIFRFGRFGLRKFFKEIYAQSVILASEKNIAVSLRLPEKPVRLRGDQLHLRRLFFNIIHNAVKFTPPGGKIDIDVKSRENEIAVSVSDTGIGITDEDLPRIFDRFFHVEQPEQNAEPGNGLGLNIALSVAKVHHGRIDVKSQVQRGTTFTVTLPVS